MSTIIDKSPPAELFIDGMKLGSSVDAVTGEMHASAIDPSSISVQKADSSDAGDHFSFQKFEDANSLEYSNSTSSSASVTFPVDGLDASVNHGLDFSQSHTSQGTSLIYLLTWERVGELERLNDDVKLKAEAQSIPADEFRSHYGDYFIYQISTRAKFVAMWYVLDVAALVFVYGR